MAQIQEQISARSANARFYDEMSTASGEVNRYEGYVNWFDGMPAERMARKRQEADALFHRSGITFAVYGDEAGTERLIPFDMIPRIIPAQKWVAMAAGCASA